MTQNMKKRPKTARARKTRRQKAEDNPRSKLWLRRADSAWGQWVHANYNRCAVNNWDCAGNLESHHLLSRAIRATRHSKEGGILLCSWHHKYSPHLSPHTAPLQFSAWLQENLPDKWDWVKKHGRDWMSIKADYKKAYEELREDL